MAFHGMRSVLGGLAFAAMACDAGPVEPLQPSTRAATAERPPDRARVLGGEPVPRVVQWPAHSELEPVLRERLSAEANGAIADAQVPVLVPSSETLLERLQIMNGPTWTAVWSAGDGTTIALHASGAARTHPGIAAVSPRDTVRGLPGFVTQNEGIWVASWIEHGVAYDLSVECDHRRAGACGDDAFVRELAASLRYVGPEEGER